MPDYIFEEEEIGGRVVVVGLRVIIYDLEETIFETVGAEIGKQEIVFLKKWEFMLGKSAQPHGRRSEGTNQ